MHGGLQLVDIQQLRKVLGNTLKNILKYSLSIM